MPTPHRTHLQCTTPGPFVSSAHGELLVWGPVVWIFGIPENERDERILGCTLRFESQTTRPRRRPLTNNSPWSLSVFFSSSSISLARSAKLAFKVSDLIQNKIRQITTIQANPRQTLRLPCLFQWDNDVSNLCLRNGFNILTFNLSLTSRDPWL